MMFFECEDCEVTFKIRFTDYLLEDGEPDVSCCPNCGSPNIETA